MLPKLVLVALASALLAAVPANAEFLQNYVHDFTGFTFPPAIGNFSRMRVTPYNEAHSDIEVDYDNHPYTVHLSAYVYPAHTPLPQHYEACKAEVVQIHPDAKLLGEKPVVFDKAGVKYHGFSAVFSFRDKFVDHTPQDLLSKLILFRRDDYFVLFRISYAVSDKAAAETEIDDFLQKFAWPPGGADASGVK